MKRAPKKYRTRTPRCSIWTGIIAKLHRSIAGALIVTLSIVALAFFGGDNLAGSALRSEAPTASPQVAAIKQQYDTACRGSDNGWEAACRTAVSALRALKSNENSGAQTLIAAYEEQIHAKNQASRAATSSGSATLKNSSTSLPVTLIPQDGSIIGGDRTKCKDVVKHFSDGQFQIWELPCYVQYLSEVALYFAGGISVLFIIIGGYKYMIGSISDDKEGGKKTLQYALSGFTITLLAWTIVNVWQVYVTTGEREGRPAAEYTTDDNRAVDSQVAGEGVEKTSETVVPVGALQQACPSGGQYDLVMAYIVSNEGAKNNKYIINGNPTIGVGHDCKTNPHPICRKDSITNAEMLELYVRDYADHVNQAKAAVPGFDGLDPIRQAVVIDLTFNQGRGWVKKFPRFIAALSAKDYETAYKELTLNSSKDGDSLYLKQVGTRARRNAILIKNGALEPLAKQAQANKLGIQMLCSGKQSSENSSVATE